MHNYGPGRNFGSKFFYDNGGSAKKKRETAGISYKNNSSYSRFLGNFRPLITTHILENGGLQIAAILAEIHR